MENESKALCSTVLLLAGTYAICILPAAHKCGNLSYITTAHERHHLKKKTEILIRSAPGVACHSVAPGDQLVEGGYLLNLYSL